MRALVLGGYGATGVPVTVKPAWAGFTCLATGPGHTEAGRT